jgi:hypothetical protein
MTYTKHVKARGLGSLSRMPGGGMILRGGKASQPASAEGRNVDLELSRMNILFLLSELAQNPRQWETTLRGIVAAYDEMDAEAAEQAKHSEMRLSPVRRVATDWRDTDPNFGPLYHKVKAALYGEPAKAEKGREYE